MIKKVSISFIQLILVISQKKLIILVIHFKRFQFILQCGVVPGMVDSLHHLILLSLEILSYQTEPW